MNPHPREQIIDAINRMVRTSRDLARQMHREPTPSELAVKLAVPIERIHRLLEIARTPYRLNS